MAGYHQSPADSFLITNETPPQSLGAGAANGGAIDMQGYDGVAFLVHIGAITGAGTLDARVERDDNSGFNSPTNVANAALTQVTNANPNSVAIIDVWRPAERYVRCVITQAANTVLGGVLAIRYRKSGILPPTQSAVQVVRVAEG